MSPFIYLATRKIKNSVKEFVKTPSKIILVLFFGIILACSLYTSAVSSPTENFTRDRTEFYAIIFALYTYAFFMTAKNGFINGASMFSMADVNLMFTAPLKEKNVLSFGLFQQLTKSLTLGIFILYQSSLVSNTYGLPASSLSVVLIGYGAVIFSGQMVATLIYSLTGSNDRKALKGKIFFYGAFVLFITVLFYITYISGISLESLVYASREKIMFFFPISGYISFAVQGAIEGNNQLLITGIIIFSLVCIAFYLIFSKINNDFYEDVLKAAQVSFSAITAQKEGKIAENVPRNIRTGKTGLSKGYGASAITFKQKKENKRSTTLILNPISYIMAIFSLIYALIFSGENIALFAINVYTMSVTASIGRWAKELTYPYIYLIPESNFKKLLFMLKADLPLIALESLVCFVPLVVFSSCSIFEGIAMTAARFTFGILFIGVHLLILRFIGDSERKAFSLIIYLFLAVLFSAPSIIAAILTGMAFPFYSPLPFILMSIINTLISFILIFICRNILEYAEYSNK